MQRTEDAAGYNVLFHHEHTFSVWLHDGEDYAGGIDCSFDIDVEDAGGSSSIQSVNVFYNRVGESLTEEQCKVAEQGDGVASQFDNTPYVPAMSWLHECVIEELLAWNTYILRVRVTDVDGNVTYPDGYIILQVEDNGIIVENGYNGGGRNGWYEV